MAAITLQIFADRIPNLFPIETVMMEEMCILIRHDGVLKLRRIRSRGTKEYWFLYGTRSTNAASRRSICTAVDGESIPPQQHEKDTDDRVEYDGRCEHAINKAFENSRLPGLPFCMTGCKGQVYCIGLLC